MKIINNLLDKDYQIKKERLYINYYSQLLCDIILLNYEYNESKIISKKDLLLDLPCLREFKSSDVSKIYDTAKTLLRVKYNLEIINENPIEFKRIEIIS